MVSREKLSNPRLVAEEGERIYQTRYRAEYEQQYVGKFVAIDVTTEKAYISDTAEGAFGEALKAAPQGVFHLIKVGEAGAFRVSYGFHGQPDWIFQ